MSTCMPHPGSSKYGFATVAVVLLVGQASLNTLFQPTGGFYHCKTEPGCTIHADIYYNVPVLVKTVFQKTCPQFQNMNLQKIL